VLNLAEGAGRVSAADKRRAFTIARGEGLGAFAALETAGLVGMSIRFTSSAALRSHVFKRCLPR
jgi:hypothetical protein